MVICTRAHSTISNDSEKNPTDPVIKHKKPLCGGSWHLMNVGHLGISLVLPFQSIWLVFRGCNRATKFRTLLFSLRCLAIFGQILNHAY